MKLLHVDSSVLGGDSVSRQLSRDVVEQWERRHPSVETVYRDLAARPPAPLSGETMAARRTKGELTPVQRAERATDEELVREFLGADVIVIGAPMYNFTIPSQLKAWLDRILIAGRTFSYTENGPIGLAGGRKVVIVSTRGGIYSQGPANAMDHQEAYLRSVFGFIGIDEVTVIRAEGVDYGPEQRAKAIEQARRELRDLLQAA